MAHQAKKRWLNEFHGDVYVKRAQREGYPSRSAYKLLEMQQKDRLFKPGMRVLDLGAAPGSWTQLARRWVGDKGEVMAIDLLPLQISSSPGITFIQGDINDASIRDRLQLAFKNRPLSAVISDMAPNLSGNKSIDQPRSMQLLEMAWFLAEPLLAEDGFFLAKIFQGEGVEDFSRLLRPRFNSLKWRKPDASRARSAEVYLLAKGYRSTS